MRKLLSASAHFQHEEELIIPHAPQILQSKHPHPKLSLMRDSCRGLNVLTMRIEALTLRMGSVQLQSSS
jgi:hypothetical protein